MCYILFFSSPTSLALNGKKLKLTIAVKYCGLCLHGIWKTGVNWIGFVDFINFSRFFPFFAGKKNLLSVGSSASE